MRQTRITTPIARPNMSAGERPSAPISFMPSSTFRPKGGLAVMLLLVPALIFLTLIAGVLISGLRGAVEGTVLGIGCGMAIGWVACVFLFARVLLMTVTVNGETLTATFPWGGKSSMRWMLIDHADRQLGLLRVHSSDGKSLLILETGLAQGERLLRQLILRVSPTVLSQPLQRELAILGGDLFAAQSQSSFPQLTVASYWLTAMGIVALVGCGLAVAGFLAHLTVLLVVGVIVGLLGALALLLLRQTVILTDAGITITRGLSGPKTMAWTEVKLIEQLPLEMMLALRGDQRIVFLGPFFMSTMRRDLLRNAFHSRLIDKGIPVYTRWWIL